MKQVFLKNKLNNEKFVCDDTRQVQLIDGVEYIVVNRVGQTRKFLMRKDALEKIKDKKELLGL